VDSVSTTKGEIMRTFIVSSIVATAVLLAFGSTAHGARDPGVLKTGKCSAGATWKLKAKRDDAGVETEFEVDQNRVGRRWSVVLRRNGSVVFRGIRRTLAPSGSFEVRKIVPGGGRIVATAQALAGGQTCRAALSV
jgi:hypothetical protein